jgi:hypothetical protein
MSCIDHILLFCCLAEEVLSLERRCGASIPAFLGTKLLLLI